MPGVAQNFPEYRMAVFLSLQEGRRSSFRVLDRFHFLYEQMDWKGLATTANWWWVHELKMKIQEDDSVYILLFTFLFIKYVLERDEVSGYLN